MQLSPTALTDTGRQRDHNEDAFWMPGADWLMPKQIAAKGALYIVADGMGGHLAGEVASGMAVDLIPRTYYADPDRDVAASLRRAIAAANAEIFRAAQENPAQAKMGTTVVAAVLHDNRLTIAHAGDSRVYLLRGENLRRLTEDHSWVSERLKAGILTPEEAANHPLRNVITRALGNKADIEPTINTYTVRPGDAVLLCTDGLWGPVGEPGMSRILSTQPPQQAATALIEAANEAGGTDNITAVVVPVAKKPAASRVPLIIAAGLVGLLGVSLLCMLSVRRLRIVLFPTATPTATATMTPTPTPHPTPTPTPRPPDTRVSSDNLGKPIEYPPGVREAPGDLMRAFKMSQVQLVGVLLKQSAPSSFVHVWLKRNTPLYLAANEPLCLQPRQPYGVILVGEVEFSTTSTTFLLYTGDVSYRIVSASLLDLSPEMRDQRAIWVRVFGVPEDATTIHALWLDGSEVGGGSWQPLSRAVPGGEWRGWFYARASSGATDGIEGLEGDSWGKDTVSVAYLELKPSASSGLDVTILRGPYSLDEDTCQLSDRSQ